MVRAARLSLALLVATSIAAACNSFDASEDDRCPPGTKDCFGSCMSTTDPFFGCANADCLPCRIPNAISFCSVDRECAFAECDGSSGDCNQDLSDGCETRLDSGDIQHCGRCGAECTLPAGASAVGCNDSECYIALCETGFEDADHEYENGCEVEL